MPFKSMAQEKYFFANRPKLESQGVNVGEWAAASKGLNLPKRVASPKKVAVPKNWWQGKGNGSIV